MKAATNIRWRLAWLLLLPITFVMSLDRTAMTVAAPIMQKDMGFTLVQMSWILTAFHWAYAIASIPAGLFATRVGARAALLVANVAWSALTLAVPFVRGAGVLIGLRFALGGFQAADMPASITALKNWFPLAERSRANAVLLTGIYLGPIIGAPLTAYLVGGFGWRSAFIAFGLAGLLSAAAWWALFRDRPEQQPSVSESELSLIREGQGAASVLPRPISFGSFLAKKAFWAIGLQGLCTGIIMGFFNTWLPTYLMQAHGVALKALGFFSSLPWMILLLVVGIAAFIADQVFKRSGSVWLARVPAAIAGFLIAAIGLWFAARTAQTLPALFLLAAALGGMGFVQVSTWSSIQEVGGEHTGVLAAWNGMLTNGGAAVGPLLMAVMTQRAGGDWSSALMAVAGVGLVGALPWIMIHPRNVRPALPNQREIWPDV